MSADKKSNAYNNSLLSLAAYRRGLPKLLNVTNQQILPNELARVNAAEQITPRYTDLINDANNTTGINNAALENLIFGNFGVDKARIAAGIDKEINPEFYLARQAGLQNLLKGFDALSFGDNDVAAERLVNAENVRSGNASAPTNATNTVSNALQFGDEKLKRVSALDQLLDSGTSFMQGSKASFDPFGRSTTGGGTTVNTAPQPSQFSDIAKGIGNSTDSLLNNVFGTGNAALTANANRRGTAEVVMSSLPDY